MIKKVVTVILLIFVIGIYCVMIQFVLIPKIAIFVIECYIEYATVPSGNRKYSTYGSVAHFDDDARYQLSRIGLEYALMDMEIGRSVFFDVIMYKVEDNLIYAKYYDGYGVLEYGILNMETDYLISSPELSDLSDEEQEVFNNIKDMRVLSNSRFKNYVIINW